MPPCAVEFLPRFASDAVSLPDDKRLEVERVLRRLSGEFGQPHLHSGLGIRRLRRNYFECRLGRDLRMVFRLEGSILTMVRIGDHEEIQSFLKGI